MNKTHQLKIVESIGELNLLQNVPSSWKLKVIPSENFLYDVYFFVEGSKRILYRELTWNETVVTFRDSEMLVKDMDCWEVSVWKVLCLPFPVFELINSNTNIWAMGRNCQMDIKSYMQRSFKESDRNKILSYDIMDSGNINELFTLTIPEVDKHELHVQDEKFYIPYSMMDGELITCHKDVQKKCWSLQLISVDKSSRRSAIKYIEILSIPIWDRSEENVTYGMEFSKPAITLLGNNAISSQIIRSSKGILGKLLGVNIISSKTCICLIGHPNGKILYSICEWPESKQTYMTSSELQLLYDMKQPIAGIHFLEKLGEIEDSGFLLLIGTFGKLVLLSAEKVYNNSSFVEINKLGFWIVTSYMHSHVADHIVLNEAVIYISNSGTLRITNFFLSEDSNSLGKELNFSSEVSEFIGIARLIALDRNKGFILLITACGNLFLSEYKKKDNTGGTSSLPLLMNECLQQSAIMQQLLVTKSLQSKVFAALTTFASLKYNDLPLHKEIAISVTEMNTYPTKFLLDIDLKSLGRQNLDPELWHVNASIYTYFQDDYTVVNKTIPFNLDQMTLCMEVMDTVLQPSYVSPFPMCVEVGLILLLPEKWKYLECFKSIRDKLPLYQRLKRCLVNELLFIKSNMKIFKSQTYYGKFSVERNRNVLQSIYNLSLKKSFSSLIKSKFSQTYQLSQQCSFTLSTQSVQVLMEGIKDSDKCQYLSKLLLGLPKLSEDSCLTFKNHPISLTIVEKDGCVLITILAKPFDILLGLRTSIIELLVSNQKKPRVEASYVSIPSQVNSKCEALSKSLIGMYGQDVSSTDCIATILKLYQELRTEISEKLFIL